MNSTTVWLTFASSVRIVFLRSLLFIVITCHCLIISVVVPCSRSPGVILLYIIPVIIIPYLVMLIPVNVVLLNRFVPINIILIISIHLGLVVPVIIILFNCFFPVNSVLIIPVVLCIHIVSFNIRLSILPGYSFLIISFIVNIVPVNGILSNIVSLFINLIIVPGNSVFSVPITYLNSVNIEGCSSAILLNIHIPVIISGKLISWNIQRSYFIPVSFVSSYLLRIANSCYFPLSYILPRSYSYIIYVNASVLYPAVTIAVICSVSSVRVNPVSIVRGYIIVIRILMAEIIVSNKVPVMIRRMINVTKMYAYRNRERSIRM